MSLEKEFKYYKDHQDELLIKYSGRFIVIRDETVICDYGSKLEAYLESKKQFEVGSFLIQHCMPGDEATNQTFHSRISFPSLTPHRT